MGWRDRDWAKLDEDELRSLYGVVRAAKRDAPGSAPGLDLRRPVVSPAAGNTVRIRVWGAVGLLVLAGAAFALTHRETQPKPAVAALTVLYGIPGSDATIDPLAPGGLQTVCTEEELATGAQSWTCVAWAVNTQHLPVVPPAQYQGACTHLLADRNEARWTCLGAQPISPQQLPPSAPPASSS